MSTEIAKKQQAPPPARQFRDSVSKIAGSLLTDWVGEARAKEATGRIAAALAASAQTAKKPEDFYACTPQSVAAVVAISALTGIMPSTGPAALAYAIPRAPRKGETPNLGYQLSHRGLNALAKRAGQVMIAIPVGVDDEIEIDECGEVNVVRMDPDNPPTTEDEFRGVILTVKDTATCNIVTRQWVAKKIINQRRDSSDAYQFAARTEWARKSDPWHVWYVPQAMKTAMHYAISRGWCIIDDTESTRAINADMAADRIEQEQPAMRMIADPSADQTSALFAKLRPEEEIIEAEIEPQQEVTQEPELQQEAGAVETVEPHELEPFPDEDLQAWVNRASALIQQSDAEALPGIMEFCEGLQERKFLTQVRLGKIANMVNARMAELS